MIFSNLVNTLKKMDELNKNISSDRERIEFCLIPDIKDKHLSVIRFNHTVGKTKYYWYTLVLDEDSTPKYIALFDYPKCDIEYAEIRIKEYVAFYNKNNPWHGKIHSEIMNVEQEICDFLQTHPLYTHQIMYSRYNAIEPYYDES